ncbi:MAG: hypothetical protein OFPII_41270 [Osedax symbiont Rs1]|nr:MAG: hypothetical protein OFPII_41270 [Osedax symbiont Rs1]
MRKIIAISFIFALISGTAAAHSGGTDSNGCHAGKKPYHCHNRK